MQPQPRMDVEPLERGDVETIRRILRGVSPRTGPDMPIMTVDPKEIADVDGESSETFVARVNGEPVGFASLQRDKTYSDRAWALTFVQDEWQSRGVMSGVKPVVLAWLRAHGYRYITASTMIDNPFLIQAQAQGRLKVEQHPAHPLWVRGLYEIPPEGADG